MTIPSSPSAGSKLATVRKLLAKAEDPAVTAAEADAYNAKAAELIAQYGIDRARLAESDPNSDVIGDLIVPMTAPYARDKASLLSSIANRLRCRTVLTTRPDRVTGARTYSVHVFGFGSDLERAELLFTSLLVQASHGMAATTAPWWESVAAFRRSWLLGFTEAVSLRLAAAEERARAASDQSRVAVTGRSVEMVLADRGSLVRQALTRAYPGAGLSKPRVLSGSGRTSGYGAGQRADLGVTQLDRAASPRRALGSPS